ncbi:MAG: DUF72 domain-containing protein [Terriglobia bacterium]
MAGTEPASALIRIGLAGWSYPDWSGVFYPAPRPRGFHELAYTAQFFKVAEINASFYRPPRAEWARNWIRQIERHPDFQFTAKLWRGFTHERNATADDERAFRLGLLPLVDEGRLGAVLLQFPWSFRNTAQHRTYLSDLIRRFGDYSLVVEVRHSSWDQPDMLAWFREQGAGICNIDQPAVGKSLGPSAHATSAIGYVRIHGRNTAHWFAQNERGGERYDYLYRLNELVPWVERVREIAQKTRVVYVIANNHPNAQSAVNAFQLENLISGKRVTAPASLIERYHELDAIASPAAGTPATPHTPSLFPE